MSSNLDAAGTITIITLLYLHGLQGFFIEMRGGVVLPIAVFLAFMGKWHMRSRVMTTGEWMLLRFGSGWQGRLARYVAAATYLVITVGMVVFFLSAAGKFLAVFLPYDETTCAVAMAVIALAYTMASGLYGVIWTDVFQAGLIGFAAIYMSVLAFGYVTPELLADWPGAASNQAWPVFFGGLETPVIEDLDAAAPALGTEVETRILYSPFIVFLIFWAGKGLLEGLGGSGGSAYMAQRFYAAKDGPTVQKLCMLWIVLFAFRWPMVLGFVILAIHLGIGSPGPRSDPAAGAAFGADPGRHDRRAGGGDLRGEHEHLRLDDQRRGELRGPRPVGAAAGRGLARRWRQVAGLGRLRRLHRDRGGGADARAGDGRRGGRRVGHDRHPAVPGLPAALRAAVVLGPLQRRRLRGRRGDGLRRLARDDASSTRPPRSACPPTSACSASTAS